jgi:cleavage and polyadenylation specificity factor subunit 5
MLCAQAGHAGLTLRHALQVPKNLKLLAVPLFELYQNERYGQVVASVPACISRFHINLLQKSDEAAK